MEFGVILGPVYPPRDEMSSRAAFELEMQFCAHAAAAGFEGVAVNHHFLVGPEAQCFQPIPMCGHILARYPELYVATTVLILSYHNPVEIAEQIATLDVMAPGRLLLGVGQGYRPKEAEAAGIEHRHRAPRMAEAIAAMRLLWRDGPSSFEGEHFTFHDADIGPRPKDPNGPPILVGADKVRTVARVPRIGADHWIPSARHSASFLREALPEYRRSLDDVGKKFAGLPFTRDVCLADDEAAAQAVVARSYERMLHMQSRWGQPGERYDLSFEELKNERMIMGSPEQVAEGLINLHRDFSAEFVFMRFYTPGMDPNLALEMVTRMGEEVLPVVRDEVGRGSLFG